MPVQQSALRAERRAQIQKPRLHREDLVEALHVAAWDRQHAQLDAPLERIRREAPLRPGQAERLQQRARRGSHCSACRAEPQTAAR